MLNVGMARLFSRRGKKYWVAALCAASFACGHYLFGDDATESASLLSQYQQATQQLVNEVQPSATRRQAATTKSDAHVAQPGPAEPRVAVAASTAGLPTQKSSRRVKTQALPESVVAKGDASVQPQLPATHETPAEEASDEQAVLAVNETAAPAAAKEPAASGENKPLPIVTYLPAQSVVTSRQLAPRMEILIPATANADSPRAQDASAQSVPFVTATPLPLPSDPRAAASPQPSQPVPQIINVSRRTVPAPQSLQPPHTAANLAELDDEHLPPIVSPSQVPRPGTRKKQLPQAAQATPVLRIDLGKQ